MSSIDDRWHGAHCPVCVQDDWVHHRVMDDGHKLLQLWVTVQIVLQNTCLKTCLSKAYMLCMDIGSNAVYAMLVPYILGTSNSRSGSRPGSRRQELPCCLRRQNAVGKTKAALAAS